MSLDTIGFMPIVDEFSYFITPPDLIPFAHTGGGGIHFGFLTDFGQVKDLNEAPIVCVSPTNDPPIRLLARNIQEFLNLASSVPHIEMLENFWPWKNSLSIEEIVTEFNSYASAEWIQKREMISGSFQETFNTTPLNVQEYVQEVLKERNEKIIVSTFDGLGIIGSHDLEKKGKRFHFDDQRPQNEKEIMQMQDFLSSANKEEKLAFIRDAYYWYILTTEDDGERIEVGS